MTQHGCTSAAAARRRSWNCSALMPTMTDACITVHHSTAHQDNSLHERRATAVSQLHLVRQSKSEAGRATFVELTQSFVRANAAMLPQLCAQIPSWPVQLPQGCTIQKVGGLTPSAQCPTARQRDEVTSCKHAHAGLVQLPIALHHICSVQDIKMHGTHTGTPVQDITLRTLKYVAVGSPP
jgi:hypothetical protein